MSQRTSWIVTLTCAALPLLGWWTCGLFDLDEGFYGAVAAEMNRRGAWVTPYYNGLPWFEKPPLLYWFAKPAISILGPWIGPRLPSIVATLALYGLIGWFAHRHWGHHAARWCVLIAASSPLVAGVGRMMMADPLFNLSLTAAAVFFWESLVHDRRWRLLSAFCLGMSVLAKGPAGLLLFGPLVAATWWRERSLRPELRGWWLTSAAVFVVTVGAWYVPVIVAHGGPFARTFLVEQNLGRFLGGDVAHTPPFLVGLPFYAVVLMIGMAPWSFHVWKAWPAGGDPLRRYLAVWALTPFVFFTLSAAKLPHYVLSCCVPLALIVGRHLASRRRNDATDTHSGLLRALRYPIVVTVAAAVVVNAAFLWYYYDGRASGQAELHALARFVSLQMGPDERPVAYQMPRREQHRGAFGDAIQETSHPSIVMYLDREVPDVETAAELLADPRAQWILTRADRVLPSDIDGARLAHREWRAVETPQPQVRYRLYYLAAATRK